RHTFLRRRISTFGSCPGPVSVRGQGPSPARRTPSTMIRMPAQALVWRALPYWAQRVILWLSNTHFVVGTAALVRDGNGRILVARHTYRRRVPWGLPGGWVRRGESPAEALVRELREENAIDVGGTHPLTIRFDIPHPLTGV